MGTLPFLGEFSIVQTITSKLCPLTLDQTLFLPPNTFSSRSHVYSDILTMEPLQILVVVTSLMVVVAAIFRMYYGLSSVQRTL